MHIASLAHAGDGNLHPMMVVPPGDDEARLRGQRVFEHIVEDAITMGGTVTGEHGVGLLKMAGLAKEVSPAVLAMHRAIKTTGPSRASRTRGRFSARPSLTSSPSRAGAKAGREFRPAGAARGAEGQDASVMHNACMPLIQIRDVPEPVRDELARKAAAAGQSMQAYLLGELSRLAERPSMAEIVARAQARARATGSTVTMNDAVAAVLAARDRQEP